MASTLATEIASSLVEGEPTMYASSPELPAEITATLPPLVKLATAASYSPLGYHSRPKDR